MYDGHMFGFGGFMWLFWLLLIIAIVWIVKALVGTPQAGRQKSALELLEERYARGEIERNEFEQKKRDLSD